MTRLLASVTNVEEAMIALDGGADIIDLKNPHEGALGALPMAAIRDIVRYVDGRRLLSATIGNLPMNPEQIVEKVIQTAEAGVDIVKIGLFGRDGHEECIGALAPHAAGGIRIVAVMFADMSPTFELLPLLEKSGLYGVMLDTSEKSGRRLVHWLDEGTLSRFVAEGRKHHLLTGLAGSLVQDDIPMLASLHPDYLGFRGGLCVDSNRKAGVDPVRLQAIHKVLRKCNNATVVLV